MWILGGLEVCNGVEGVRRADSGIGLGGYELLGERSLFHEPAKITIVANALIAAGRCIVNGVQVFSRSIPDNNLLRRYLMRALRLQGLTHQFLHLSALTLFNSQSRHENHRHHDQLMEHIQDLLTSLIRDLLGLFRPLSFHTIQPITDPMGPVIKSSFKRVGLTTVGDTDMGQPGQCSL